ncbi:hypothetical protein BHYA_0042g00090 [Botrytis hyacinthi]|uniref:Uncharacterized protein n=1 Tax=Botrytis hyacinthi TaxID=278943 RepID=A0A4Z1GUD9_9HELO|nr:hypothetical protein BHYA_0042g00090 [Botrytis hyacinthi]
MTAHKSSRSQYTHLDSSSSIVDAEKTEVENKDEEDGNGKYERIRRPSPRDTDAIFDGDSDANDEAVSESQFETDSMIPVGDKGEEKSKFRNPLKESRSTIAPEFESESRPQSSSVNFSTGIKNQSSATGNSDNDKIEDQYQQDREDSSSLQLTPTSTAEFVTESDTQSIHHISAKIEIDHGAEGADADDKAETASQTAAHSDSLELMNPFVEQDDTRRNASIRATIKGLQKSIVTVHFHIFLTVTLLTVLLYLEFILHQNCEAYFCDRASMKTLLNTVLLLLSWEMFVIFDFLIKGNLDSHDIRYYDAEEIPDGRLTKVLNQLRFHQMRSIVTPFIAWIWFWIFASARVAQFPTCHGKETCAAIELGGTNGTANATAVAFIDSTSHFLLGAVKNATNAIIKALMGAAAQD